MLLYNYNADGLDYFYSKILARVGTSKTKHKNKLAVSDQ